MRPYLALIKDSFRAAFASRVLYVLLGIITVLLLAIAPLHVKETLDWNIKRGRHIINNETRQDVANLAKRLVDEHDDEDRPEIARIWDLFDATVKKDIEEWIELREVPVEDQDGQANQKLVMRDAFLPPKVVAELNNIVKREDFYRAEDWESKILPSEAQELIDDGVESLNKDRTRRLNRLLIGKAFNPLISSGAPTSLHFRYAGWHFENQPVSSTRAQFRSTTTSVTSWIFDKFVLSIGLFIAILVTSNMIPETFAPGSLNLLLSKPVSRFGLLMAKFVGGCAFVTLCAAYLFIGVWLWMGLALGIWDQSLLWSIPLYVIVFAIYYSVSTLAGIWWRSPILSIVITALFWAACFGVGTSHSMVENRVLNDEIINLVPVGDSVMQLGTASVISRWDEGEKKWNGELEMQLEDIQKQMMSYIQFLDVDNRQITMGPIVDPKSGDIVASSFNPNSQSTMSHQLLFISPQDTINFREVGRIPRNCEQLFADKDGLIAVNSSGDFFRYDKSLLTPTAEEAAAKAAEESDKGSDKNGQSKSKRKKRPQVREPFTKCGPNRRVAVRDGQYVTYNSTTRQIFIYRAQVITAFSLNDQGMYIRTGEVKVDTGAEPRMSAEIHSANDTILLALGNGQIITLDAQTLKEKNGYQPDRRSAVKQIRASSDGRYFAVTYMNQRLWLLDTLDDGQMKIANVSGQGSITSAAFDENNRLWVADSGARATRYELNDGAINKGKTLAPPTGMVYKLFRYGLDPFYRYCPKPGEFYKVVRHLSSTSGSEEELLSGQDLSRTEIEDDPYRPLWTGLLFMFAMLILAGSIFHYQDF